MKDGKDILNNDGLRASPFKMPEGYLEELEQSVSEQILQRRENRNLAFLKPALGLACAFAMVFGMGYGIMALTGTLHSEKPKDLAVALYENGFVSGRNLDYYYEETLEEDLSFPEQEVTDLPGNEVSQ